MHNNLTGYFKIASIAILIFAALVTLTSEAYEPLNSIPILAAAILFMHGNTASKFTATSTLIILIPILLGYEKDMRGLSALLVVAMILHLIHESRLSRERAALRLAIDNVTPSDNIANYIIEESDYERDTQKERNYRKYFFLPLLELFSNCCAKCKRQDNGVDLDHFMFSKSSGGSFAMRHEDGYFVNNGIPLCQTCNRSKSNRNYKNFFTETELLSIFEKSKIATKMLNEKMAAPTARHRIEIKINPDDASKTNVKRNSDGILTKFLLWILCAPFLLLFIVSIAFIVSSPFTDDTPSQSKFIYYAMLSIVSLIQSLLLSPLESIRIGGDLSLVRRIFYAIGLFLLSWIAGTFIWVLFVI